LVEAVTAHMKFGFVDDCTLTLLWLPTVRNSSRLYGIYWRCSENGTPRKKMKSVLPFVVSLTLFSSQTLHHCGQIDRRSFAQQKCENCKPVYDLIGCSPCPSLCTHNASKHLHFAIVTLLRKFHTSPSRLPELHVHIRVLNF